MTTPRGDYWILVGRAGIEEARPIGGMRTYQSAQEALDGATLLLRTHGKELGTPYLDMELATRTSDGRHEERVEVMIRCIHAAAGLHTPDKTLAEVQEELRKDPLDGKWEMLRMR